MKIQSEEYWRWIEDNRENDPTKLRLKLHGSDNIEAYNSAITQIVCRKKCALKLADTLKAAEHFFFPSEISAEMSTSDVIARIHASLIPSGSTVVDLTAGLGIDVFTLARKAAKAVAVEINADAAAALKYNADVLGLSNVEVIHSDCEDFLRQLNDGEMYDVAFIDPARRSDNGDRVYALSDCKPDVTELLPLIQKHFRTLIVKASPMLDISALANALPGCTEIIIPGTTTECKELVAVINLSEPYNIPYAIKAVTVNRKEVISEFEFTPEQEKAAAVSYAPPAAGEFLYEPYPALMKSGGMRILASKLNLQKLHPNTHLFTSAEYCASFPGDIFEIIEALPYASKHIKRLSSRYPVINVSARNFKLSAAELAKKLGVKTGGDLRLFGCVNYKDERMIIICKPAEVQP
ncbi:MAG: class I SAM-dependent methyltransferase [Muribaculaceae bacterium]|nr:class I SAM-dependent methyltransferase [Muribaculaceae bacterium]